MADTMNRLAQLRDQLRNAKNKERFLILLDILRERDLDGSEDIPAYISECKELAVRYGDKFQTATLLAIEARYQSNISNFTSALLIYNESLKLFEELNDLEGMAGVYQNIGLVYHHQSKYPLALDYYQRSVSFREKTGDKKKLAMVITNIGNIYFNQGTYPKASEYHLRALKIMEELRDNYGIGASYLNIGNIYLREKKYPEASHYYFLGRDMMELSGDRFGIVAAYLNISGVYLEEKQYNKALSFHLKTLKMIESLGNLYALTTYYFNIGNIYRGKNKEAVALDYYAKAYNSAKKDKDTKRTCETLIAIGDSYTTLKEKEKAYDSLMKAVRLTQRSGNKFEYCNAYLSIYKMHKYFNEPTQALKSYEKYIKLKNELDNKEVTEKIASLQISYDLEKKEKDLEIEHLRNVELKKERDRSEALLLNILPAEVAEELKEKGTADAKLFDDVTVLFTDFKSFTTVSERLTPQQLVDELHACFSAFDRIMTQYGIEKIKTVGDAYLAISGLPQANPSHAEDLVNAAIDIREFMLSRKKQLGEMTFEIRIGLHSGSVVAGIVGVKKFAYDIWGDTVNTAARMEQNSEAGRINISETTYQLVKNKFNCEYRGEIEAKNKGKLKMYFVN
jgi:class 3 adenylate cyclase